MSGILLNLCLASSETRFDNHKWGPIATKHGLERQRSKSICWVRYEDDILIISLTICDKCCQKITKQVYDCGVNFEDSNDCKSKYDNYSVTNKFLDMCIQLKQGELTYSMWRYNKEFLATRDYDKLKKHRYPPPLGPNLSNRLLTILQNRIAKWDHMLLGARQKAEEILYEIMELHCLGYPKKVVLAAWNRGQKQNLMRQIGVHLIHMTYTDEQSQQPRLSTLTLPAGLLHQLFWWYQ